jgi:hypothetical protein
MNLANEWGELPQVQPPQFYYDPARNCYWMQNSRSEWIPVTETSVRRFLKSHFSAKPIEGEPLSALDRQLNEIQSHHDIHYSGPLAGASKGLREFQGKRILVTDSPVIIAPSAGPWPTFRQVLENLFVGEDGIEQLVYLFGWLKFAREALYTGKGIPGQLLAIAGPRSCGKSLLQELITLLLGGRSAKPHAWMMGATDFNGDLFGGEHLVIEDEAASYDLRTRRVFGTRIKELTVNRVQRMHAKHRQALYLDPFWRVSLTVNDEDENLTILPPLDESIADKIILLRAYMKPMPMPTGSIGSREHFMQTLIGELPAFCAYLEDWQVPAAYTSERFGITHFHHPALIETIDSFAPEARMLQIIELGILAERAEWTGSSVELERELTEKDGAYCFEARKLLSYRNACGLLLARLAKKYPNRVIYSRTSDRRTWTVRREPSEMRSNRPF